MDDKDKDIIDMFSHLDTAQLEYINNSVKPILNKLCSPQIKESLDKVTEMGNEILRSVYPFIEVIKQIDFSPLLEFVKEISFRDGKLTEDFLGKRIDEYMEELYHNNWFPSPVYRCSIEMFYEIGVILDSTHSGSKNRTKKLDKLIFDYYNEDEIKTIKRKWRENDELNVCYKRIIGEAIRAYEKRNYATTVTLLTLLWQNIICQKAEIDSRQDNRIKQALNKLIEENGESKIYYDFFENCIYYQCYGYESVKNDVPGRHMVAHSWIKEYPSRKTALNAILFTDFIVEL